MIKVYAFRWVPPAVQGLVRDLRVRWALEEAGLPYEEQLIGFEDQGSEHYRRLQPFGQVPAFEQDGLTLFESGAIVMHVAEQAETLMPRDREARARTQTWMFAALSSVEPVVGQLGHLDFMQANAESIAQYRSSIVELVNARLASLSASLGDRQYLQDRFTAADLLMTTVLRMLRDTDLVAQFSNLEAYRVRCEARPAFQRALAAQLSAFARNAPPAPAPAAPAARKAEQHA